MQSVTVKFHPVLIRETPLLEMEVVPCARVEDAIDAVFIKYPALFRIFSSPVESRHDLYEKLLRSCHIFLNQQDIRKFASGFQTSVQSHDVIYIRPILLS